MAPNRASSRRKQALEQSWPDGPLEFQHPKLVDRPPSGAGWTHEVKLDGYRMQAHVRGGRARLFTRNGHDWTDRLPTVALMAGELDDCILDAELCLLDDDGYSSFSGLRAAMGRGKDAALTLLAFDVLWRGQDDLRGYSLKTRKAVMDELLAGQEHLEDHLRAMQPVPVAGGGQPLLDAACALKWEGIVSKRLDAPYRAGRGEAWVKSKCRPSETVVVGGWVSNGITLQKLLVGLPEPGGGLRYVGSLKSGFGRERRLTQRLRALEAPASPFSTGGPRKTSDTHWTHPTLRAEVEMAEFTASGQMRQATFKGFRDDLNAGDDRAG